MMDANWKKWTAQDIEYLKQHYETTPTAELEARLGRTDHAIKMKAWALGFHKKGKYRWWSKEDIDYLKTYYPTTVIGELEKHFKRNGAGIYAKALQLNLKKADGYSCADPNSIKKRQPQNYHSTEQNEHFFPTPEWCHQSIKNIQKVTELFVIKSKPVKHIMRG